MQNTGLLDLLSRQLGIVDGFHTIDGSYQEATLETKRLILEGFGVDVDEEETAQNLLSRMERLAARLVSPVIFRTQAEQYRINLQAKSDQQQRTVGWQLHCENGKKISGKAENGGDIILGGDVPLGYHQLRVKLTKNIDLLSLLIIVPEKAALFDAAAKKWGITLPLYGLRSARNWGIGDYEDLAVFAEKAAKVGASYVGINPVHALFPKNADMFSPYSPSSREFLNIMLIAPDMVPELNASVRGKATLKELLATKALEQVRESSLVDYKRVYDLKWRALNVAFGVLEARASSNRRKKAFERFLKQKGRALWLHALYETIAEIQGTEQEAVCDWQQWPEELHDPDGPAVQDFADKYSSRVRFYCYVQWIAAEQLAEAQQRALDAGMSQGLYLDIAVGMVPGGAEVWANRDRIAKGVSLGAPGDAANPDGQKWHLAPLNPAVMQEDGFSLFRETLQATMQRSGMVRIDHILGVNRCFWIGLNGQTPGGYVEFPREELLAIIALESVRNDCIVVGEDLGIVPPGFSDVLNNQGLYGCSLFPFERTEDGRYKRTHEYEPTRFAALSNHDFPTMRGYWEGRDLETRQRLGIGADQDKMAYDLYMRDRDREGMLRLLEDEGLLPGGMDSAHPPTEFSLELAMAMHSFLARTKSQAIAVQLEDMLMLEDQFNLPGTVNEYPNWRQKIPEPIENIFDHEIVKNIVQILLEERP